MAQWRRGQIQHFTYPSFSWEVQKSLETPSKPCLTTAYFRREVHSKKPPSPDGCMVVSYLNVINSERFYRYKQNVKMLIQVYLTQETLPLSH